MSSTPIQEIFYIQNKNLTTNDGKESNGLTIPNNDHFLIQAYSKIIYSKNNSVLSIF